MALSERIPVDGISHGDKVRLTGRAWREGRFHPGNVYEVDDESFHRPVIYEDNGLDKVIEWYIFDGDSPSTDYSVTKVG